MSDDTPQQPPAPPAWTLEEWLDRLGAALDVDLVLPSDSLLDLTREVAHGVARAAPLTTFLVGYAAAQRGGGPDDVAVALDTVRALMAERA